MNIIMRNAYRVEVQLSMGELEDLGITYEQLDYKNIETRRVLWLINEKIKSVYGSGFSFSGKLLIEVIKESDDKVCICFSQLSRKEADEKSVKQLVKCDNSPVIVQFSDFEKLLSLCRAVNKAFVTSLFEKTGKYRLVFYVPSGEKEMLFMKISEFSEDVFASRLEEARCEELWCCLIKDNAVKRLTEVFSATQQQPSCRP